MKLWANGNNLSYHDEGKGVPALVFLHHWGGSSRTSAGVRQRLSAKYRTVALDFRGWGESDAPEEGYSIVDMTNDVQRRAMLGAYDDAASAAGALDHVLTAEPLTGELRQQAIEDSLRGAPQAKRAWPTSGRAEDVAADIARIDVPTIVITGELDKVDPVPILQRDVVERIRGTRLEILRGAGHLLPVERPADLAESIGRFVARNVAS